MTRLETRFALLPIVLLLAACGGAEEGAVPAAEVREAIASHIHGAGDTLALILTDPRAGDPVSMAFDHVHESVDETPGGRYVACADFRAADGTVYDVDYYVRRANGRIQVEDVVLHKVAGQTVLAADRRARLDSLP